MYYYYYQPPERTEKEGRVPSPSCKTKVRTVLKHERTRKDSCYIRAVHRPSPCFCAHRVTNVRRRGGLARVFRC